MISLCSSLPLGIASWPASLLKLGNAKQPLGHYHRRILGPRPMLFTCYLREGFVYIPTMARRVSEPIYTTIEPVAVVRLINTEEVRRALLETIARKNILIPH